MLLDYVMQRDISDSISTQARVCAKLNVSFVQWVLHVAETPG